MMGIVERTGAWYLLPDGSKVQGRDGLINRVKEDLELQQTLKNKIFSFFKIKKIKHVISKVK